MVMKEMKPKALDCDTVPANLNGLHGLERAGDYDRSGFYTYQK